MAQDWSIDVHKYAPDAPSSVIDAIVRYCGIALQKRDSSLVSFTQPEELTRVRENFLKKKLGLTNPDPELDSAISEVGQRMKTEPNRNRVTVYYLLAERFRRLSVFGGPDAPGGSVGSTFAGMTDRPAAAPVGAATQAFSTRPAAAATATAAAASRPGWMLFLPWLLGAALLALLVWWLFSQRPGPSTVAGSATVPAVTAPTLPDVTAPAISPATPAVVAGLPTRVHFALDSAALDADAAKAVSDAASVVKRDNARVAITGYTDRTGDLALNQELAKNRATAVRDALVAAGVPLSSIEMRPPLLVETGAVGTTDADARRVEISRL